MSICVGMTVILVAFVGLVIIALFSARKPSNMFDDDAVLIDDDYEEKD